VEDANIVFAAPELAAAASWPQYRSLHLQNLCYYSLAIPSKHRLPKNIPDFVLAAVRFPSVVMVADTLVPENRCCCQLSNLDAPMPSNAAVAVVIMVPVLPAAIPMPPVLWSCRRHLVDDVVVFSLLMRPLFVVVFVSFPSLPLSLPLSVLLRSAAF